VESVPWSENAFALCSAVPRTTETGGQSA